MDGKMFLHIYYWDKRTGTKEKVSFVIAGFEDYKAIVKGLRSKRLKIVTINIEHRFNQEKRD